MQPIDKSIMVWMFSNCKERSIKDWVATLGSGGIGTIKVKSHDGLLLMGKVAALSGHPLALVSLDVIGAQYEAFKLEGVRYIPWCNPNGIDVAAEAELAIAVARRCDNRIEIDLEPYKDFWTGSYKGIPEYFKRLKEAGLQVTACIDVRSNQADPLGIDRIVDDVDLWMTQSYDVGFSKLAGYPVHFDELYSHAVQYLRKFGIGRFGIVMDATAGTGLAARAAFAEQLGAVEVSCWAADQATAATYAGMAQIPRLVDEKLVVPEEKYEWEYGFAGYAAELAASGEDDPGLAKGAAYAVNQSGDLVQWGEYRILYYSVGMNAYLCVSKIKQPAIAAGTKE